MSPLIHHQVLKGETVPAREADWFLVEVWGVNDRFMGISMEIFLVSSPTTMGIKTSQPNWGFNSQKTWPDLKGFCDARCGRECQLLVAPQWLHPSVVKVVELWSQSALENLTLVSSLQELTGSTFVIFCQWSTNQ